MSSGMHFVTRPLYLPQLTLMTGADVPRLVWRAMFREHSLVNRYDEIGPKETTAISLTNYGEFGAGHRLQLRDDRCHA